MKGNIKIFIFCLMALIPEMIFSQNQFIPGIFKAESTEYDLNSQKANQINHTLLLNSDRSFIYKKTHQNESCNYNYIGNWNASKNELILNFLAEESLALKIVHQENSQSILLQTDDLLLHPVNSNKLFFPSKQIDPNQKKKYKDPPCPKF